MERSEALKLAYEEACRAHNGIAEFRGKLLGLLPLASGAGIFLLLGKGLSGEEHLPAVGVFGLVVTFGLYLYELRGVQECLLLRDCGKRLEKEMLGEAEGIGAFAETTGAREKFGFVGNRTASTIVYSAVIGGWTYVALSQIASPRPCPMLLAGLAGLVSFIFGQEVCRTFDRNGVSSTTEETE